MRADCRCRGCLDLNSERSIARSAVSTARTSRAATCLSLRHRPPQAVLLLCNAESTRCWDLGCGLMLKVSPCGSNSCRSQANTGCQRELQNFFVQYFRSSSAGETLIRSSLNRVRLVLNASVTRLLAHWTKSPRTVLTFTFTNAVALSSASFFLDTHTF